MDAKLTEGVERRNQELACAALRAGERRSGAAIAAIELCPEGGEERRRDRELVRAALATDMAPREIGSLFVTVVADLTYDVDWGDQFKFWPILAKVIDVPSFDLNGDLSRRRATAAAFDAFAERHRGVTPVGSFAQQFPLMSRTLVHSMLPTCSQRHVARLLARASSSGGLPADASAPWPVDDLVALGELLALPLFVRGLLENRSVIEPAGRALLGFDGADPPAWARRISQSVRADRVTHDLVERARQEVRAGRGGRAKKETAPRMNLAFTREARGSALWVELSPIGDAHVAPNELPAFARSGAMLRLLANKKVIDERPIASTLAAPVIAAAPLGEPQFSLSLTARPIVAGQVPEQVGAYLARSARYVKVPIVLRDEGAGRFVEITPTMLVEEGAALTILTSNTAALRTELSAAGFAEVPFGSPTLVALVGVAGAAAAAPLAQLGVDVRIAPIMLQPILVAPLRREQGALAYPPGSDIWLLVRGAAGRTSLRAEVSPAEAGRVELHKTEDGEHVLHLEAMQRLEVRVGQASHQRPICKATIHVESPRDDAEPARWRACLQPAGATIKHLVERHCWLHADSLRGVSLRFELAATFAGAVRRGALRAGPGELATPFAAMRFLDRLLDGAEVKPDAALPEEVELRAWSDDEPDFVRTIARVGRGEAALSFELTKRRPTVLCEGGATTLERLDLSAPGQPRATVSPDGLDAPGVYIASFEATHAALCIADRVGRLPRFPAAQTPRRDLDVLRDLVGILRALDVADIWPAKALAQGVFLRRSAVRTVERALVGSICGEEWLRAEDELAVLESEQAEALRHLRYLTWISEKVFVGAFVEIEDDDDPFSVLEAALQPSALSGADRDAARHLLLLFYCRSLASPSGDERALRLAWANRQVSRLVRLAYLALPEAFERWRAHDKDMNGTLEA